MHSLSNPAASAITATKQWIQEVVIGCNFCPFAAEPFKNEKIHYAVCETNQLQVVLQKLVQLLIHLDEDRSTETSLLILEKGFQGLNDYLHLVSIAEELIEAEGYEGVYQIASFHPDYIFAGSAEDDPANYTNRSPYPMLHILREESLTTLIDKHKNIDAIPDDNIRYARDKGLAYMKALLQSTKR
jgi:uncharacterized protein